MTTSAVPSTTQRTAMNRVIAAHKALWAAVKAAEAKDIEIEWNSLAVHFLTWGPRGLASEIYISEVWPRKPVDADTAKTGTGNVG